MRTRNVRQRQHRAWLRRDQNPTHKIPECTNHFYGRRRGPIAMLQYGPQSRPLPRELPVRLEED